MRISPSRSSSLVLARPKLPSPRARPDFGVSFQENVTLARIENVPIVSIAAVIQHNTSGFASPVDRAIRRPRDFAGKKYGSFGLEIERQILSSLMECDGGDFSAIEFVDIGASDPFVAWERGDVDFIWIFEGWTHIEAQQRGIDLDFMRLNDLDCIPDYYTPVLITGEQMIAERPGRGAALGPRNRARLSARHR